MTQKLRLVMREFAIPDRGGLKKGRTLEYADQTTPAEDAAVAEYFREDMERLRADWNWLKDTPPPAR